MIAQNNLGKCSCCGRYTQNYRIETSKVPGGEMSLRSKKTKLKHKKSSPGDPGIRLDVLSGQQPSPRCDIDDKTQVRTGTNSPQYFYFFVISNITKFVQSFCCCIMLWYRFFQ